MALSRYIGDLLVHRQSCRLRGQRIEQKLSIGMD